MKKIVFGLIAATALSITSCNQIKKEQGEEQVNSAPKPVEGVNIPVSALATTKDLVCGMDVDGGQIADTTTYEGKVYGFCSKECKASFIENPQSYITQK